jgi:hypothetical protein
MTHYYTQGKRHLMETGYQRKAWLGTLIWLVEIVAMNSIVVPSSRVNWIDLLAHKITLSHFLNQSMPRIISMPWESMMMRFEKKSTPLMAILIVSHIFLVFISPLGELTIMVYFMMVVCRLCFGTNFDDMKECDAPESNKIIAGCEFARNIPNTTSWECWASSVVTWLTLS